MSTNHTPTKVTSEPTIPKEFSESSSSYESEVEPIVERKRVESPVLNKRLNISNTNSHSMNQTGGESLCCPTSSSDPPSFSGRKRKTLSKFSFSCCHFKMVRD